MILAFWKPKGPTSFKFLYQIKKIAGTRKVGHAGTLDPLAEGILIVAIGRQSTKKLATEVKKEKEYLANIKLGEESTTDDEEGEKTKWDVKNIPTLSEIEEVIKSFIGKIKQTPPLYSAIKIQGKEAYKFARKGRAVNLESREVEVKNLEILEYEWPILKIKVTTGPGVYIRSLARDIGKKLKVGGYIKELTRTRVGEFTKDTVITLEELEKLQF